MWLGIASIPLGVITLGLLLAIPAIVLGRRVQKATPVDTTSYRPKATAGILTGIAGCALSLLIIALAIAQG